MAGFRDGGGAGVLRGEYCSFQEFIMSWDQNASVLWWWGEGGIRGSFEGEGSRRGASFGLEGGVVKMGSLIGLRLFSEGELWCVSEQV